MKITFLGHASWMMESGGTRIVTDLLVENQFRNGTFSICPTRGFDLERLPKLDGLIITHRHRDHFDLETLVRMDRNLTVYTPNDRLILMALNRLGYRNVVTFSDWSAHTQGDLTFIFTPSDNRVPENGVLISDSESVFWNHVDTVVNGATIERVREYVDRVDLVAHGYQPMLETAALESVSLQFPYAAYSGLLHRARLLDPRAIAPASNGYRTTGKHAWFNAYKFPVSRERFASDVKKALPSVETFIADPGDVIEIGESGMRMLPQSAEGGFVRTVSRDARELMAFDPSAVKPALVDENESGEKIDALRSLVHRVFLERVPEGCRQLGRHHGLRHFGAILDVRVIYPDAAVETWRIDLSAADPKAELSGVDDRADYVMDIAASNVCAYVTGRTRSDIIALSGQLRLFSRAYRVSEGRVVRPDEYSPADVHGRRNMLPWVIFSIMGYERDFEARQVDAEIDALLAPAGSREPFGRPLWERPAPPLPKGARSPGMG